MTTGTRPVATEARPVAARTRPRRRARIIAPVRRRLGLRRRLVLTFALGAAALSIALSIIAYGLTRQILLDQRESAATTRALENAAMLATRLPYDTGPIDIGQDLLTLSAPQDSASLLQYEGQWYATDIDAFDERSVPDSMRTMVEGGQAATMRVRIDGQPVYIVGTPLAGLDAQYYDGVPLGELERTLNRLAITLFAASLVTTLLAGGIGYWATRSLIAPLLEVGTAAEAIAGGRLDTRLPEGNDPDIDLLAAPFNVMAEALETRIERDARFASEVSHELRSPLMTLSASVEVLENNRDELTERASTALDLLAADVARLQQLVDDLLEISRYDVGAVTLHLEDVAAAELVAQSVSVMGGGGVPVHRGPDVSDAVIRVDKRRFGRVIANLLDNAQRYADGATLVSVDRVDSMVRIAVEDRGPGVAVDERDIVFDRFSRGSEAGNRSSDSGVGLGLALVDEHVRLLGGRVWVEERLDGQSGARFVVELPLIEPPRSDEEEEP